MSEFYSTLTMSPIKSLGKTIMKKIAFKSQALLASAALGLVYTGSASAFLFETGDIAWRVDSELTAGVSVRTQERNQGLVGVANGGTANSVNGDDGNLNFDKDDIVSAATKLTTDWSAQADNLGFAARTRILYDPIYDDDKSLNFANGADRPVLLKETQDRAGADFELAEAYFVGNFDIAGHDSFVKAGRVILNWGESVFTQGGINIDPANLQNLRAPGAKIRDAFIGSEMVNLFVDLTENLGLETFYQFGHNETEADPQGTFFSTADFDESIMLGFGRAPEGLASAEVFRVADNSASDDGQAGLALRYYVDAAGGIQLGMYLANYHSRAPVVSAIRSPTGNPTPGTGDANQATYFLEYPEDNQLIGVSANGVMGDWSIYGELVHHIDLPQQIDDIEIVYAAIGLPGSQVQADSNLYVQGFRELNVSQATFGGLRSYGSESLLWADSLVFGFEVGMNQVHDMPSEDELRFDGPGTSLKGGNDPAMASPGQQVDGYATPFSWGYKLIARLSYFGVTDDISLIPRAVFFHDVDGVTPGPFTTFVEDRKSATLALTTRFSQNFDVDLSYTNFFGGGDFNTRNDRDNASLTVAYRF
jgi:hypothetical protein